MKVPPMSPLVRCVSDAVVAQAERVLRFARRVNADLDRTYVPPTPPALPLGTVEALTLAHDALLGRCLKATRGPALAAIDRELKAAGYVWQQTTQGMILIRPRPEERRRTGRSSVDPHAGMNPTLTERRTKERS